MTEKQWARCTDLKKMLNFLRDKGSDRKMRLFACGCVRQAWEQLTPESRAALEVSERYADGAASRRELTAALRAAAAEAERMAAAAEATMDPEQGQWDPDTDAAIRANAAEAARLSLAAKLDTDIVGELAKAMYYTLILWPQGPGQDPDEAHCGLLREVFGNPFRTIVVEPGWLEWNNGIVAKLAQRIYDERAFERLPMLADALGDAGCSDGTILGHLRSPHSHVRGCWALDAILGK